MTVCGHRVATSLRTWPNSSICLGKYTFKRSANETWWISSLPDHIIAVIIRLEGSPWSRTHGCQFHQGTSPPSCRWFQCRKLSIQRCHVFHHLRNSVSSSVSCAYLTCSLLKLAEINHYIWSCLYSSMPEVN